MTQQSRSEILSTLSQIILEETASGSIEISEKTTARNVPGWDSLSHINIILSVEDKYKIKFKSAELAKLQNVKELIDSIVSKGSSSSTH